MASSAGVAARLDLVLSAEELERVRAFGHGVVRDEFITGRVLLRLALGRILGLSPALVPLGIDPLGRPVVRGPWADWSFSVSHAAGLVAVAITRGLEVGLDVEAEERGVDDWKSMAGQVLGDDEVGEIDALPMGGQAAAFLRFWVAKEAVLKALGIGISGRPRELRLSGLLGAGESPRIVRLPGAKPAGGWELVPMQPVPGWIGFVACGPGGARAAA